MALKLVRQSLKKNVQRANENNQLNLNHYVSFKNDLIKVCRVSKIHLIITKAIFNYQNMTIKHTIFSKSTFIIAVTSHLFVLS